MIQEDEQSRFLRLAVYSHIIRVFGESLTEADSHLLHRMLRRLNNNQRQGDYPHEEHELSVARDFVLCWLERHDPLETPLSKSHLSPPQNPTAQEGAS